MSELSWLERSASWMAVTDNVPPIGRCVLAAANSGVVHEAYRTAGGRWRWSHGNNATVVTHWMELPSPPAQFELNRITKLLESAAKSE